MMDDLQQWYVMQCSIPVQALAIDVLFLTKINFTCVISFIFESCSTFLKLNNVIACNDHYDDACTVLLSVVYYK